MASLREITEELNAKRYIAYRAHEEFKSNGGDWSRVTALGPGSDDEKHAAFTRLDKELNDLQGQHDRLSAADSAMKLHSREWEADQRPVNGNPNGGSMGGDLKGLVPYEMMPGASGRVNLVKMITDSASFKAMREQKAGSASIELPVRQFKTLLTLTEIHPASDLRAGVTPLLYEQRTVADLMGQADTNSNEVSYWRQVLRTNAAAPVAEGTQKPESALDFDIVMALIRTIATHIPVTRQALDDVPFLDSLIRNQLAGMVIQEEEEQLLSGSGVGQNILGLMNTPGLQVQPKGTDETPAAIYKAMQLVRGSAGLGFAEPTALVIHPADWVDIKLLRGTDGHYLYDGGPGSEAADRIWGLPVRQTTGMAQNTAIVGNFAGAAQVVRRMGVTVTASTEHGTNFTENKVTLLAESRLTLIVTQPAQFATITGI